MKTASHPLLKCPEYIAEIAVRNRDHRGDQMLRMRSKINYQPPSFMPCNSSDFRPEELVLRPCYGPAVKTRTVHCEKKLACLMFDFGVINTTDDKIVINRFRASHSVYKS